MQSARLFCLVINLLFCFVCSAQLTSEQKRAIEQSNKDEKDRQKRAEEIRQGKIAKSLAEAKEWDDMKRKNSTIAYNRGETMNFYTGTDIGGQIKSGYSIQYQFDPISVKLGTRQQDISLASWDLNDSTWTVYGIWLFNAKKTLDGYYYAYRIRSITMGTLRPYLKNPENFTLNAQLVAVEDVMSGRKSPMEIKAEAAIKLKEEEDKLKAHPVWNTPLYGRAKFNSSFFGEIYGYKLSIAAKDSFFLLKEDRNNHMSADVFLMDMSKKTIRKGSLFLVCRDVEPKPNEHYNDHPERIGKLTEFGFKKLERLVNEKLGKISMAESQRLKKKEDEFLQGLLKAINESEKYHAKLEKERQQLDKTQGALVRNAPAYTFLKFSLSDRRLIEGMKLKYPAHDSIFMSVKNEAKQTYLTNSNSKDKYTIYLIDQKLKPGSYEGELFGFFDSHITSPISELKTFSAADKKLLGNMEQEINSRLEEERSQKSYQAKLNDLGARYEEYSFNKYGADGVIGSFNALNYYGHYYHMNNGVVIGYEGVIKDQRGNFFHGYCTPAPKQGVRFNADGSKTIFQFKEPGRIRQDGYNYKFSSGILDEYGYITITKDGDLYVKMDFDASYNNAYMITRNGDFYAGGFDAKGQLYRGEMFFANGDIYIGPLKDGKFDGKGVLYTANERYDGYFINGIKNGNAEYIAADNAKYYASGYYTDGKRDEKKSKKIENNYNYIMEWGRYWNYGERDFSTVKSYLGDNYGKIIYKNGNEYIGKLKYKGGVYSLGILTLPNGIKLYGRAAESIRDTSMGFIQSHFNEYMPIIVYPNKEIYFGHTNSSLEKHGYGILYKPNGDVFMGIFRNDLFSGSLIVFQNGDIYAGGFSGSQMNGRGRYIDWEKKEKFFGNYVNGERHGKGIINVLDGKPRFVEYKNGVLLE